MRKHLLIAVGLALALVPAVTFAAATARTIVNPAANSPLTSAVMRNELQILENEITNIANAMGWTTASTQSGTTAVVPPVSGGTGINNIPMYGQVLVGNSSGTYTLTATSSLGITGGGSAGIPGGADTQIQFNDAGTFGATSDFAWDKVHGWFKISSSTPGSTMTMFSSNFGLGGDTITFTNDPTDVASFSNNVGSYAQIETATNNSENDFVQIYGQASSTSGTVPDVGMYAEAGNSGFFSESASGNQINLNTDSNSSLLTSGNLLLSLDANTSGDVILDTSLMTGGDSTAQFPDLGGTIDVFCFKNLGNCATGGGVTLETNGSINGSQSTLNLVNGTNVTLTDNGSGSVTIDASGGGSSFGQGWEIDGAGQLAPTTTLAVSIPTWLSISDNTFAYSSTTNGGTIVGLSAGAASTMTTFATFSGNTAIGVTALQNAGGINNTALGYQAGNIDSHTQNGDTFVGYKAGISINAGSVPTRKAEYNTFLGYQSGKSVLRGYGNINIGVDQAVTAAATIDNNVITLGNDTWPNTLAGNSTSVMNYFNFMNFLFGTIPATTTSAQAAAYPTTGSFGIATSTPWGVFAISLNAGYTGNNGMAFVIASTTGAGATSTLFSVDNTGAASTTLLFGAQLSTCTGSNFLQWTGGSFSCTALPASGSTDFVFNTKNFGTTTAATTSSIWTQGVFFSSSTVAASQFPYASSTEISSVTASTTNEVVSSLTPSLELTAAGGVLGNYTGSNPCTNQVALSISATGVITCTSITNAMISNPNFIWLTNFATGTAATTTSIWTQGAFFSSSTKAASQFPYASSTDFSTANASTSALTVDNITNALFLGGATGVVSKYGGSSGVCTNQFPTSISAIGAEGGCTSVSDAFFSGQLGIAHGGTNAASFTTTNNAIYYTGSALATAVTTQAITTPYASSTALTAGNLFAALNVGIATSTPYGLFSVFPNGISGPAVVVGSTSATYFLINNGGHAGFGTSTPGSAAVAIQGNIFLAGNINATSSATSSFSGPLSVSTTSQTAFMVNDGYNDPVSNVLMVKTASSSWPYDLFQGWSATSTGPIWGFDSAGHMMASSTYPTLSSCGTTPSLSNDASDFSGTITVGSVAATACTLTFGNAHTIATHCIITEQTGSVVNASSYTESLSGFTYSQTGLTSDKLDYVCTGK